MQHQVALKRNKDLRHQRKAFLADDLGNFIKSKTLEGFHQIKNIRRISHYHGPWSQ